MNSPNHNNHTASGVAQNEKVRVRALARGARLKSKLHSPPQDDRNWKLVNTFATRLGRQMGEAHSICTQVGPKHRNLCMATRTSLHLMEKNRNWFWRQSSIILILLKFSLPSVVAPSLLS